MHNIDRTQLETEWEDENFEFEGDHEGYDEVYSMETDEVYNEYESDEYYGETEGPFNETEEMEYAAELLSISSEEELDQFLGKLFKKVARGIGKVVKSPIFRPLGGIIKGVVKSALPVVGGALGSFIPIPGVGTAVGAAVGNAAGKMLGLELEGMSGEDQEFEVARRLVRLVGDAAQQALEVSPSVPPRAAAQQAIAAAAQKHAPGLVNGAMQGRRAGSSPKRTGKWIRRGKVVILLGLND